MLLDNAVGYKKMSKSQNDASIRNTAYHIIRNSIMTLKLKPGTVISTQEVAKKLDISRTPVREAFIRLQQDGLVDIFPQHETVVSKINLERLNQEYFFRQSLECSALKHAIRNVSQENIVPLIDNIEAQIVAERKTDIDKFMELDNEFHKLIFELAGMPLIWESIQTMDGHYDRVRFISLWNNVIFKNLLKEHQLILTAIEEHSLSLAKEYVTQHLNNLNNQLDSFIEQYPDYFEKMKKTLFIQSVLDYQYNNLNLQESPLDIKKK